MKKKSIDYFYNAKTAYVPPKHLLVHLEMTHYEAFPLRKRLNSVLLYSRTTYGKTKARGGSCSKIAPKKCRGRTRWRKSKCVCELAAVWLLVNRLTSVCCLLCHLYDIFKSLRTCLALLGCAGAADAVGPAVMAGPRRIPSLICYIELEEGKGGNQLEVTGRQ